MSVSPQDTIVALSTPWLPSGVAVIRASGPLVKNFLSTWLCLLNAKPRHCYKSNFIVDGRVLDEGLWVYFAAPFSYTGEDVLELYPHGSTVVIQAILDELVRQGARLAREGEFTQRAYLAGKIDLSQAEAVHELIESVNLESAMAASESIRGAVRSRCHALEASLIQMRVLAESYLDFSDEDMVEEDFVSLKNNLNTWLMMARDFCTEAGCAAKQFSRVSVAILGSPNVGKSSLMNVLTKTDTSIINERAGTTRDVVMADVVWGSKRIHLLDTAGIRETQCPIEKEGIDRIQRRLGDVGCVLWVLDANSENLVKEAADALSWLSNFSLILPIVFVLNKTDLLASPLELTQLMQCDVVFVSCLDNTGFDLLISKTLYHLGCSMNSARFYANQRQVNSIAEAIVHVEKAVSSLYLDECFAQDLCIAHRSLMQVLGHFSTEDLLGSIFSTFCIGK